MASSIIRTGSKLGKTTAKKASKARLKEVMSTIKTGLPPKFRKTVLGDADISGTGAPQYERLKKTLGRDKAEEVISNLKKEFKREERKIRRKTYKSQEAKEQALERHYKQYGMEDGLPNLGRRLLSEKKMGGKVMKDVPADNPGLAKLPTKVRNRMGYKQTGGKVTAGSTSKGSTRGTPSQGARAYEAQIKNKQKFLNDMAKEEAARIKAKGGEIY
tara:strand:- start:1823 stop:2470 length:648 start_codon:yes stop_codon:yes gene_type:complete